MWASPIGQKANSGLSFFNCSASIVKGFEDILDGFYLLLVGAGFGFRVLPEDIVRFPKLRRDIDLISQNYTPKKRDRQEYTTTEHHSKDMIVVHIGDSRNAWIDGLRILFQVYTDIKYQSVKTVIFNYDNIRDAGLPIKGFGGKSSGAVPYINMIEGINKILSKKEKLDTIDVSDIMNLVGMCVVSGNVRR
jgi:ribonucleoside-diphosphate reductase alpha chain/ribonucleoside-triphosphate reductase